MSSTGRWLSKELLAEARREAKITADSHTFEDHCECICPQNLLLWAFLRQLQTATRRASGGAADLRDSASLTFGNAAKAVKEAPWRVWNHEVAQKLKGIGSTTASVRTPALCSCTRGRGASRRQSAGEGKRKTGKRKGESR
jgi:hypothetical protein